MASEILFKELSFNHPTLREIRAIRGCTIVASEILFKELSFNHPTLREIRAIRGCKIRLIGHARV